MALGSWIRGRELRLRRVDASVLLRWLRTGDGGLDGCRGDDATDTL